MDSWYIRMVQWIILPLIVILSAWLKNELNIELEDEDRKLVGMFMFEQVLSLLHRITLIHILIKQRVLALKENQIQPTKEQGTLPSFACYNLEA